MALQTKRTLRVFTLAQIELATNDFAEEIFLEWFKFKHINCKAYLGFIGDKNIFVQAWYPEGQIGLMQKLDIHSIYQQYPSANLIGYCKTSSKSYLVHEHVQRLCSLFDILERRIKETRIPQLWEPRLKLCICIAETLHRGIAIDKRTTYRSVKAETTFLDTNFEFKLLQRSSTRSNYQPEDEVYDIGNILLQVFRGTSDIRIQQRSISALIADLDPDLEGQLPKECSRAFLRIVLACTDLKECRPTISGALAELYELYRYVIDYTGLGKELLMDYTCSQPQMKSVSSKKQAYRIFTCAEIELATTGFADENYLGWFENEDRSFYLGHIGNKYVHVMILSIGWGKRGMELMQKLDSFYMFQHCRIATPIGYHKTALTIFLVYEHAETVRRLSDILGTTHQETRIPPSWVLRLKICIGVAEGIFYLHQGIGLDKKTVHGCVCSECILVDANSESKLLLIPSKKSYDRPEDDVYHFGGLLRQVFPETEQLTGKVYHANSLRLNRIIFECDTPKRCPTIADVLAELKEIYRSVTPTLEPRGNDFLGTQTSASLSSVAEWQSLTSSNHSSFSSSFVNSSRQTEQLSETNTVELTVLTEFNKTFSTKEDQIPEMNALMSNIHASKSTKGTSHIYTLDEIHSATNNFHESLAVGNGGYGDVYRGFIDGVVVAIKRLRKTSDREAEFQKEIELVSQIRHCRLVSLIGYCRDKNETVLVYEYMSRGNLYDCLHKNDGIPPNWKKRLDICVGTAIGLHYLHEGIAFDKRILHADIKSSNILLNENFEGKLSDFGLSTLSPLDRGFSFVERENLKYTPAYVAPEYKTTGPTVEADVYSFGVVLLEVLCGVKVLNPKYREAICRQGSLDGNIDPNLEGQVPERVINRFVRLSLDCLNNLPKERPKMIQVLTELLKLYNVDAVPSFITSIWHTWNNL